MIGRTFSHYRIVEKLGEGGMGEVFLAEDTSLDRKVAIKFLSEFLERDETARKRFLREAKSAAALDHPFICSVHEVGEDDGKHFIVMECIEGETLKDRLERGPLSHKETLQVASEIAEALQKAHQKGIVHRDLKPSNLMLTSEGHIKVMDFGLAKQTLSTEGLSEAETPTGLTREGTTVGTLLYMSPEQIRGLHADQRSDIFSFGVVLYELLTGMNPFKREASFETSSAIVQETPPPLIDHGVSEDKLQPILERMLAKNPSERYQTSDELSTDLKGLLDDASGQPVVASRTSFWTRYGRARYLMPSAAGLVALVVLTTWILDRYQTSKWAQEVLPGEVERLTSDRDAANLMNAFKLVEEAKSALPEDPDVDALWDRVSSDLSFSTDPEGASVYIQPYDLPNEAWQPLGTTPVTAPVASSIWHRFRIEKDGYEPVHGATHSRWAVHRSLDRAGDTPPGMVRVSVKDGETEILGYEEIEGDLATREFEIEDFYIDDREVTNAEFNEFIRAGGYQDRAYWKHEFIRTGEALSWDEAMALLKDATGRAGPATWHAGDYPDGQDDYPVTGVSWYEAAAYAEFAGKSLPTIWHWRVPNVVWFARNANFFALSSIQAQSNFGDGPVRVGSLPGVNFFGVHDMAGNVREWCWNESPNGRCLRGGAWNDAPYMYAKVSQADPFDRSAKNGFRCVTYLADISELALEPFGKTTRDFYAETPVSDEAFEIFRNLFSYDRRELVADVEVVDDTVDWVQQRITFDAAYGNERMVAYLFLPKHASPPYQTVLFFPGSGAMTNPRLRPPQLGRFTDFLVKSGRALVYPIYKGTHERSEGNDLLHYRPHGTHRYVEFLTMWVKDARRTLDYLETRDDIDHERFAYYGVSWGGYLANVIPAVDDRFKANLVAIGGFAVTPPFLEEPFPEADLLNYAPRVTIPTLMLSGRYDLSIPLKTNARPMFDFLGTPEEHKFQKVYETDHFIPINDLIKESLDFLDRYLGPVTLN